MTIDRNFAEHTKWTEILNRHIIRSVQNDNISTALSISEAYCMATVQTLSSAGICMLTVNTFNNKVIAGSSPNFGCTRLSAACSKQSGGTDDNYSGNSRAIAANYRSVSLLLCGVNW